MPEGDVGRQPISWLEEAVRRLGQATLGRERRGVSHDDADDVTGTAAADDAIGFNPLPAHSLDAAPKHRWCVPVRDVSHEKLSRAALPQIGGVLNHVRRVVYWA
jgi:hypothetical protein